MSAAAENKVIDLPVTAKDPEIVTQETMGAINLSLPLEERAAECRRAIQDARHQATVASFDLALRIMEASENGYASIWGFRDFDEYAERELQMGVRKAYYFAEVGKAIRSAKLTKEQVDKVGWTKMKEIAKLIMDKPQDAQRYLGMAETLSTKQLQDALRAERETVRVTEGQASTPSVIRMDLKFEAEAGRIVSDAIKLASTEMGVEGNNSLAVQHITAEWLQMKGADSSITTVEDWISHLERIFGVKLQVIQSDESVEAILGESAAAGEEEKIDQGLASVDSELDDLLGMSSTK